MSANFVNIEDILDEIELQSDFGTYTNGKKRYQLKAIALNGVREFDYSLNLNILSIDVEVNGDGTIDLPDDFLDYSMIFVQDDNGRLIPLSKNSSINISNDPILDQDGIPILDHNGEQIYGSGIRTSSFQSSLLLDERHDSNGDGFVASRIYGGAIYGAGGGRNQFGYYKYDVANRTIQLDLRDGIESVILDYVTDSINEKYDIIIPAPLREVLIAWVNWRVIQYRKNTPDREKERAQRDYFRERKLAKRKLNPFRLEEWVTQNSTYQMQSLKF